MSMPAEKVIEIVKKNIGKRAVRLGFNSPATTITVKDAAISRGDIFFDLNDETLDRLLNAPKPKDRGNIRFGGQLDDQFIDGEVGVVNRVLQDAKTGWFATRPLAGDRVIRVKDMAKMHSLPAAAFYNCDAEKIVVPATITKIGEDFCGLCGNLKEVVFEGPVKEIPARAFQLLDDLRSVIFKQPGCEKIGDSAFYYSGIRRLDLPATVKEIGKNAFGSSHIQWIKGPGVVKIAPDAFFQSQDNPELHFPKCPREVLDKLEM